MLQAPRHSVKRLFDFFLAICAVHLFTPLSGPWFAHSNDILHADGSPPEHLGTTHAGGLHLYSNPQSHRCKPSQFLARLAHPSTATRQPPWRERPALACRGHPARALVPRRRPKSQNVYSSARTQGKWALRPNLFACAARNLPG